MNKFLKFWFYVPTITLTWRSIRLLPDFLFCVYRGSVKHMVAGCFMDEDNLRDWAKTHFKKGISPKEKIVLTTTRVSTGFQWLLFNFDWEELACHRKEKQLKKHGYVLCSPRDGD